MKEQIPQPAPLSHTLQGKSREANTASVPHVLQAYKKDISQRQEIEDDELLQGKFETAQRDELEDDELLQGKFETAQREELEDDELLQGKFETTQRQEAPNNTGLPDNLKAGVEQLSGLDMNDVKVHYNSSKPASVQAYAYTQGADIHVAPGQEKHLGHEAWHVAQQKQGRVQPTTTVGGMAVNDNVGLENEADVMGEKAVQMKAKENNSAAQKKSNEKQYFGFADNRTEFIRQTAFSQKINQNHQSNSIQRMAAVARENKSDEEDIIVMSSLNYALSAAGGPLVDFNANANFSTMRTNEKLIIVSHGDKGKIGGYNSTQTVNVLTEKDKAIPKDIGGITLMSCYSGLDESGPDTSLVDQVADKLKDKGYTDIPVKGAMGMAIASQATSARAVKPSKDNKYFRDVQYPLFFKYGFVKTYISDSYFGNLPTELKTADEFLTEHSIDPSALNFDEKVTKVSDLTSGFYRELIDSADRVKHLIEVGKDGVQVTWKSE